ncbi:MAG: DUF2177 family protein [Candidatus Aminicenantes bacterium]|nr:DUF2177 family protein [Candidatus Aminicenantes bacterium]
MGLKQTILTYLIAFVVFFAVDMVWLGLVAKGFYRRHLGEMLSAKVNWPAAILFYLLFIAGLVVFAVRPVLLKGGTWEAAALGAFLGLLCYATYDLTNLATLKNWPLVVTIVDLIWGTVLGGGVSVLTVILARFLKI